MNITPSPLRERQRASYKRDNHRQSNGYRVPYIDYTPIYVWKKIVGGITPESDYKRLDMYFQHWSSCNKLCSEQLKLLEE